MKITMRAESPEAVITALRTYVTDSLHKAQGKQAGALTVKDGKYYQGEANAWHAMQSLLDSLTIERDG